MISSLQVEPSIHDNFQFAQIVVLAGGSAKAAGELVSAQGGNTLEYMFIIGLPFLKGSDKLDAPVYTMLDAED